MQRREIKLSPREEVAVKLSMDGKANKLIAYEMGVTLNTVNGHIHRVLKRHKMSSRFELVTAIYTNRILELEQKLATLGVGVP